MNAPIYLTISGSHPSTDGYNKILVSNAAAGVMLEQDDDMVCLTPKQALELMMALDLWLSEGKV